MNLLFRNNMQYNAFLNLYFPPEWNIFQNMNIEK